MIACSEKDGVLEFAIRVVPRASRSIARGVHDGTLSVRVTSSPVDGAANEEVERVLARAFDVPGSDVEIIKGLTSKLKRIRIRGARREQLERLANGE